MVQREITAMRQDFAHSAAATPDPATKLQ